MPDFLPSRSQPLSSIQQTHRSARGKPDASLCAQCQVVDTGLQIGVPFVKCSQTRLYTCVHGDIENPPAVDCCAFRSPSWMVKDVAGFLQCGVDWGSAWSVYTCSQCVELIKDWCLCPLQSGQPCGHLDFSQHRVSAVAAQSNCPQCRWVFAAGSDVQGRSH